MNKVVIDASVVLSWLDKDDNSNVCQDICALLKQSQIVANSPDLLFVEVINVLLKKKKISPKMCWQVIEKVSAVITYQVKMNADNYQQLINLAHRCDFTAYDSVYALLAEKKQIPLLTLDRELLHYPLATTPQKYLQANGYAS